MRFAASPTERTTAATDALLGLAAAGGVVLLQATSSPAAQKIQLWSWAFAFVALAAALGAVYHGVVLGERRRRRLWQVLTVLLSLAISLVAVGVIHDAWGAEAARISLPFLLTAGLLIYAASRVLAGLFIVFIAYQALALAVTLAAYAWMALRGTPAGAGWMAVGAAVSLIAAGAQTVRGLRIAWIWEFDRNGIYHLLQTLGLVLFCVGLSRG